MATPTAIESYVDDFLNLNEAKPKTVFCDLHKIFWEEKIFENV